MPKEKNEDSTKNNVKKENIYMTELEIYKMLLNNLEDMVSITCEHDDQDRYQQQLTGYVYATVDAYCRVKNIFEKQAEK